MATDTGYSRSNDDEADDDYGYRSHKLGKGANPELPAWNTVNASEVSYNGFEFPPFAKCRATLVPEYNKAGTSIKWITVALTVEFIITPWETISAGHPTIDDEMDTIRTRLMQPCQTLTCRLQGLGDIRINHTSNVGTKDVNNGPKPQVFEWAPIGGGLAAEGQWLCVAWISPCYTSDSSVALQGITEFGYELKWNVNKEGFLTRVVTVEAELAQTRTATNNGKANSQIQLASNNALIDRLVEQVDTTFPRPLGFHRETEKVLGKNKRTFKYVVTDTEIPSDQILPKGAIDLDFEESLSSSFENKGFSIWDWEFTGKVIVANAGKNGSILKNKNVAFLAIIEIIRDRLAKATGKTFYHSDNSAGISGSTPATIYQKKVSVLPNRIKFTNSIYKNELSVDLSFSLFCSSDLLFQASGMFDAVRIPGMTWVEWAKYLKDNGVSTSAANMVPGYETVVDLCHPLTTIGPKPSIEEKKDTTLTLPPINTVFGPRMPGAESTWIDYRNTFVYMTKNFTVMSAPLSSDAKERQESAPSGDPASSTKDVGEVPPVTSNSNPPALQTSAEPISYVTMIGKAIRVGYPIEPPRLISVGGSKAILTGDDIVLRDTLPSGWTDIVIQATDKTPAQRGTVNIYMLRWRRTYALQTPPANWGANVSGKPEQF